MSIRRGIVMLVAAAATLALSTPANALVASHAAAGGTEIVVADTAFGPALAVGSGPYKNYTLYYITSDHIPSYGCTAGATSTPFGPFTCTGPSNDKSAEWPALTTTGQPVAGPGVNQALLGRVYRKGVGYQVTYAGHPLYLFDQMAGSVTGEGWFEPGLLPWHGMWWLMSPAGEPVPWAGTLTTTTVGGHQVLAESYNTGLGWISFPVYTFNSTAPYGFAACSASAACSRAWPPVLTEGRPGWTGQATSAIGETSLTGGLTQVTWNGRPLYLFSRELLMPTPNGGAAAVGNGNGVKAFGGMFSLVPAS